MRRRARHPNGWSTTLSASTPSGLSPSSPRRRASSSPCNASQLRPGIAPGSRGGSTMNSNPGQSRRITLIFAGLTAAAAATLVIAISGAQEGHADGRPRSRDRRGRHGKAPRSRPPSTTRCASCGRTTSRGRGWRSSASPPGSPTCGDRGAAAPQPGRHRQRDQALLRPAAGNRLTALLKEHIAGAVELLQAAKAGDRRSRLGAARPGTQRQPDRAVPDRANPRFLPLHRRSAR